jgi:N6-adenosine-specific RNA methylase IME4
MQIAIDSEFKRLIPALLPEEFRQLEANILQDGEITVPLAIWKSGGKNILLDGHNRFKIAEKNGLKFSTTEIKKPDRDNAKLWVLNHQLGRRNLTDDVRLVLVGKRLDSEVAISNSERAAKAGKTGGKGRPKNNNSEAQKSPKLKTATIRKRKRIAKEENVSEKRLRALQKVKKDAPELESLVQDQIITFNEAKKLSSLSGVARTTAVSLVKTGTDVRAAIRTAKKEDYNTAVAAAKPKELEGTYRILYADPPWKYIGLNKMDEHGHAERHYDCLDDDQLKKYKVSGKRLVRDMADKNAVLFLWVTSPLLERCFAIIEAWGFEYKSSFVWDKVKHNMGHYNSVRHELLLIATRGSCKPDVSKLVDSVQSIGRTKHSEKPEEFRKIIEGLYDHGRKLELFRRGTAPAGWDIAGNEAV